ncbi:hypothetical protein GUI12_02845 [Anaplasmataceae bacterium AB001_6]|nr:hypothetical protein GUI12_02845 [Anaplasmataceae bacterium AB001_6]
MKLNFGLKFRDLYSVDGIIKLNSLFDEFVLNDKKENLIDSAILLQNFILSLFDIKDNFEKIKTLIVDKQKIYYLKRNVIQKKILSKNYKLDNISDEIDNLIRKEFNIDVINEKSLQDILNNDLSEFQMDLLKQYFHYQIDSNIKNTGILFSLPKKIDHNDILLDHIKNDDECTIFSTHLDSRDDFSLSDVTFGLSESVNNANYCIFCHNRGKDSCRLGIKDKSGEYKKSHNDEILKGCPLKEHISEMNYLFAQGDFIAALIVVMINNPMCPATGYRICNDCSMSCIYQKQTPVNIPGIESNVLMNVLKLDYGFEIYSLLTRWNPVSPHYDAFYRDDTKQDILVVGSGPSGFSMAHYMLNYGHNVVMIDSLKIEPLDEYLTGEDFKPIKDINEIFNDLKDRTIYGFGGVMEYGITVRWNKNLLKVIRIILERRSRFKIFGGIHLGYNLTLEDALNLGFSHIVLAIGFGSPKIFS